MADIFKQQRLYLGNALDARFKIYTRNSLGVRVLYAGADVTVRLSLTPNGAAITGLGPFTLVRNDAGEYAYTVPSSAIDTGLTALAGEQVYAVLSGGPANEIRANVPYEVVAERYVA